MITYKIQKTTYENGRKEFIAQKIEIDNSFFCRIFGIETSVYYLDKDGWEANYEEEAICSTKKEALRRIELAKEWNKNRTIKSVKHFKI
jgi:hypothetical protein